VAHFASSGLAAAAGHLLRYPAMDVYVCEDEAVVDLGPLTLARPACDLSIGGGSLVEMLGHFGRVHRVLRPYLQDYLTALDGKRTPHWGGSREPSGEPLIRSRHGETVLVVNARLIPNRPQLITLRSLVEAGHRGVILTGETVAAAILHRDAAAASPDALMLDQLASGHLPLAAVATETELPRLDASLPLLETPADLLTAHEEGLEAMLAVALDSGRYIEQCPGLFLEQVTSKELVPRVDEFVAVRSGPVLIDAAAEVGPFCCLDGPLRIGRGTKVHPRSWLGPGTVVGHDCRLGGEVSASVIEPFSNKAHAGFLGHSHLGSWVNLAAGTITGNLKYSYGTVRLQTPDGCTTDSGRQFFGCLVGDFSKTGIQTTLPCGGLIGPAATVEGRVAGPIAPFTTVIAGLPPGSLATVDQVATALRRMMARRGITFHEADRALLAELAN
jgi:UDP-N-acetylglucosamine diphosphorylase/glucosamine-1-phosphate N-acetyltransferase